MVSDEAIFKRYTMTQPNHKYDSTRILLDVSRAVNSSLDLDTVVSLVLKESRKALEADHAALFLADEKVHRLSLAGADGFSEDEIGNIELIGSWEVIGNELMKGMRPIVVNDIKRNHVFKGKSLPVQSFMAAPLKKDGPRLSECCKHAYDTYGAERDDA